MQMNSNNSNCLSIQQYRTTVVYWFSLYALHAYNNIIGLQCMQMNSNNSYQFSSI